MSALLSNAANAADTARSFLELTTWRLHNSDEDQAKRVSDYLEQGLFPSLTRAGAKPVAAFSNLIGPDGPSLFTLVQYASMGAMQDVLAKLDADSAYTQASQSLRAGSGMPFVTMESSLFHSLAVMPQPVIPTDAASRPPRVLSCEPISRNRWSHGRRRRPCSTTARSASSSASACAPSL